MKKTFYSIIGILLLLVGCQSEKEKITIVDISSFIPDNITKNHAYPPSSEKQKEMKFFLYMYKNYINRLSTLEYYTNELFIANLFYNGNHAIILNHISQFDNGSKYEIPHKYIYDESGSLVKIICLENANYYTNFYYKNGLMSEIIGGRMSIPFTTIKGHNIIYDESENFFLKTQFYYKTGFLDKIEFRHSRSTDLTTFRDYQYYLDIKDKSISYIKLLDRYLGIEVEFIICFNNDKIKYVTYTFEGVLEDIYLFSYNGNNILIKNFIRDKLNKNGNYLHGFEEPVKNEYFLFKKYEIIFDGNLEIENILETIDLHTKSPYKNIYYYQYQFLNNKLIGFSIFEAETDDIDTSNKNQLDYQLSNAYILLKY